MKRSFDTTDIQNLFQDDSEPNTKVVLVEREPKPGGVQLVNPSAVAKKSYEDYMDLSEGASSVNTMMQTNARNKLEIIGRQMKNLQELMTDVFEETRLNLELHDAACNFVKKPGHIYHLYERSSGQKYFGMLSPEEWQTVPHKYLGSYMLESDLSWTVANSRDDKYQGINFLKRIFMAPHLHSLT